MPTHLHPQGGGDDSEDEGLRRWSAATSGLAGLPPQQLGDHQKIVGQYRGTHEEFEVCATLDEGALHAAPTKQHGDAAFDAGAEPLALLECAALFERFAFGAARAALLWDAGECHASRPAGLQVLFGKEAAIRTIQRRRGLKDDGVAVQRRLDMDLVGGVAIEHLILSNQPTPALGEKYLMTELHRFEDLASFDQVGVGFENRIQLVPGGHLLAVKDATASLVEDAVAERTVARDLLAERVNHRTAFVLRHMEGLKLEEVADGMGVSLATVKRWIGRASQDVSALVEDDLTGEYRVARVDSSGVAIWTVVQLGLAADGWHELLGPALPPGTGVIVDGQRGLPDSIRVRVRP